MLANDGLAIEDIRRLIVDDLKEKELHTEDDAKPLVCITKNLTIETVPEVTFQANELERGFDLTAYAREKAPGNAKE